MIYDEISVHNFGVFQGRQTACLTPPSEQQPVVLFGGLNGGGKTTLLEALQLAMYGKLAAPVRQRRGSYEDYLRRSIHRRVPPNEGAAVELAFRAREDGQEREYRVRRSWSARGERVKEFLQVFVDGTLNEVLSEAWPEHVERFIPSRLAHLFFFDGEQIEALADPEQSASLLSAAVNALLGVDLVSQLKNDLKAIERRKRKESVTGPEKHAIEEAEDQLRRLTERRQELYRQRGSIQNERNHAYRCLEQLEDQYAHEGGELFEQRQTLEREKAELENRVQSLQREMRDVAAGPLPMILIQGLLDRTLEQAEREAEGEIAESVRDAIRKRDERLFEVLREASASQTIFEVTSRFVERENEHLDEATGTPRYLAMPVVARQQLSDLLERRLASELDEIAQLRRDHQDLQVKLENTERRLATVPDEDAIAQLRDDRELAKARLERADQRLAAIDGELEQLDRQRDNASGRLNSLFRQAKHAEVEYQDTNRVIDHAGRAQETLDRFRVEVVRRHASRLEELILKGYRQLLRKEGLVSKVRIAPDTYELMLLGSDGEPLLPDRLSAGERQLLAVSMLWGLGQATGKPLPVAIDTPLGRLDASHRQHLLERYFPCASHQVLLFSTDEEIDERCYQQLQEQIGHVYRLEYDDAREATSLNPGYFWIGV